MAGRKKDNIWVYFNEEPTTSGKGVKAKCKNCGLLIMGLVARMKKHVDKCFSHDDDVDSNQSQEKIANSSTCTESNMMEIARPLKRKVIEMQNDASTLKNSMNAYVIKTNKTQKHILDEEVAKYIYATNSAFHHVQHPQFKKMVSALRPGYTAPNEVEIGGALLDKIYNQEKIKCSEYLTK